MVGLRSGVVRVTAVAAVLCLGVAGCSKSGGGGGTQTGGTPQKGGVLNVLGSGDVDYMDPNLSYYSVGYMALRTWSRQPYNYPADKANVTKAVPDLATGLPKVSAEGKTATFTIRKGAQWDTSPPRQVTAADEIRGIKRTCNPAQPFGGLPDYKDLFVGFKEFCDGFAKVGQTAAAISGYLNSHDVAGLKVGSDDRTVVLTLTHPAAYLADMMTLTAFSAAPKEYDAFVPASAALAKHTIADGPYKIESYDATKKLVFVRNPAWKADSDPIRKAYVDKIIINETVTQESTQQQLQTGTASADMEFDNFPPPSQLPGLIASKDPNLNLGFTASSNPYVVFDIKSPNNNAAMAKPEFRQALMYAIDRGHILQALGGPKTNPALTHVLPESLVGGKPDFDPYQHDANKAKQMLAQAGFPNGVTLKFLYRNASEGQRKSFATIQQDLKTSGVTVVGVPVPNADFYTKYLQVPSVASRGVWDVSLAGWGSDWYGNAALSFFNPLYSGPPSYPPVGSNFGFYNSPQTNDLIKQAVSAKTEGEAGKLWHQADEQVMKDAPFFPITQPIQPNYHAKQVHNAVYIPELQQFDYTNVWLDRSTNGG